MKKVIREEIRTLDKETGEVIVTPAVTQEVYPPRKLERFWKTQYNHDTDEEARRTATTNFGESLTEQAPKDQVDINHILAKFGIANVLATRPPGGGFLEIPEDLDLRSALHKIREGTDAFQQLPQNIQQHFETMENYLEYIDQAQARGDRKALQNIGLIPRDPPPPAPPAPPQTPAPVPVKEAEPPKA